MENKTFLEKLKFGIGDGNLQYYLYNWKCPSMGAEKVRFCFCCNSLHYSHFSEKKQKCSPFLKYFIKHKRQCCNFKTIECVSQSLTFSVSGVKTNVFIERIKQEKCHILLNCILINGKLEKLFSA